jgi:hypothetical protein
MRSPASDLKLGRHYRISVEGGRRVEGRVRSLHVPPGSLLNRDGGHVIWVTGRLFDWFLTPDEIDRVEAVAPLLAPAVPAARPQSYRGRRTPASGRR